MTSLTSLNQFILSRCSHLVTFLDTKFQTADLDEIVHELVQFYQHDISKLYLVIIKHHNDLIAELLRLNKIPSAFFNVVDF